MFRQTLAWMRERVRGIQIKSLWQAATVVILGLTAAFGGLATSPPTKAISIGEAYSNGPLRITPVSLVVACTEDGVPSSAAYAIRAGQLVVILHAVIKNESDEDVPFGDGEATRVFKLLSLESNDSYLGVFEEQPRVFVTNIAARSAMDATVVWKVPSVELVNISDLSVAIYDLEKMSSLMLPTTRWAITQRMTGGLLTVSPARC